MYPTLFSLGPITIHAYGFLIATGAFVAYLFAARLAKRQLDLGSEHIQSLVIIVILAAFVGGKFFFYLEKPGYYFSDPSKMISEFRNGFVFYGSLLFCIPTVLWYLKKNAIPIMPMLDIMALATLVVHAFGRMGCFLAGCCYGKETDGPIFVTFTDEASVAPTNVHLHPTQLYGVFLIASIFIVLWMFRRYQRFEGQLFFMYIMLYAVGRGVIEVFRGDVRRGFIIEDVLSHSQLISLVLIAIVGFFYIRALKKAKKTS